MSPKEAMPKSKQAILKALALDSSKAEAHLALGEVSICGVIGISLPLKKNTNDPLNSIRILQALSDKRYIPQYSLALVYFALGDKERVFERLKKPFGREDALLHLKTEPIFEGLHAVRFADARVYWPVRAN